MSAPNITIKKEVIRHKMAFTNESFILLLNEVKAIYGEITYAPNNMEKAHIPKLLGLLPA
jgi:hypothetical protein